MVTKSKQVAELEVLGRKSRQVLGTLLTEVRQLGGELVTRTTGAAGSTSRARRCCASRRTGRHLPRFLALGRHSGRLSLGL